MDILLPGNAELHVKKGDHVKGGSSILATIPDASVAPISEEAFAEPVA